MNRQFFAASREDWERDARQELRRIENREFLRSLLLDTLTIAAWLLIYGVAGLALILGVYGFFHLIGIAMGG